MVEIKRNNIPVFIGKFLLMIILNFCTGYIFIYMNLGNFLFYINLRYIFLIILSVNFIFNIYALIIRYERKTITILKWFDAILLIIFVVVLILIFILYGGSSDMASHGGLFTFPLYLSIICFLILLFIDIKTMKKIINK
jgi:peptidoglycan/LPS O-acetylase OafA/YrhL